MCHYSNSLRAKKCIFLKKIHIFYLSLRSSQMAGVSTWNLGVLLTSWKFYKIISLHLINKYKINSIKIISPTVSQNPAEPKFLAFATICKHQSKAKVKLHSLLQRNSRESRRRGPECQKAQFTLTLKEHSRHRRSQTNCFFSCFLNVTT